MIQLRKSTLIQNTRRFSGKILCNSNRLQFTILSDDKNRSGLFYRNRLVAVEMAPEALNPDCNCKLNMTKLHAVIAFHPIDYDRWHSKPMELSLCKWQDGHFVLKRMRIVCRRAPPIQMHTDAVEIAQFICSMSVRNGHLDWNGNAKIAAIALISKRRARKKSKRVESPSLMCAV